MRTIVHLSDLHFGRVHQVTLQPLILAVAEIQPHLVAVSGDLTQRARVQQFKEARSFLDLHAWQPERQRFSLSHAKHFRHSTHRWQPSPPETV
jgi:predicted MPP superfamily phosphohydrolase